MNILAFCSALDKTYLAIKFGDKIIEKTIKSDENYHSLYLIQELKNIFSSNKLSFDELDFVTVNCGPGSFTGIRVALSIAKIITGELKKPLVPLNTAQILLETYNCNKLIMDARRDMFFVGTKDKIELILKENVKDFLKESDKILVDKNSKEYFKHALCYEEENKNIALTMLKLAENKFLSDKDKKEFDYLKTEANYIQTPPVF